MGRKGFFGGFASSLIGAVVSAVFFICTIWILPIIYDNTNTNEMTERESIEKLRSVIADLDEKHKRIETIIESLERSQLASDIPSDSKPNINGGSASEVKREAGEMHSDAKPKKIKPPPPLMVSTRDSLSTPSLLVVGGTDGSGTRRVVQLLTQLGVTMVSEDPETFDIHADLMGGWPLVVKPVLQLTGSLRYSPSTFPDIMKRSLKGSLGRLLIQAERDSHKPESRVLAVGGRLPTPPGVRAAAVSFGFKAPVAMTLVPLWAELHPHFKLLHVLRDGRDIAFSVNQGPVEKFYQDMYKTADPQKSAPEKAIRLWSDWNVQCLAWAQAQVAALETSETQSLGYYALHSEDLISSSLGVRFAALSHLAKFVGSDISSRSLCCLAVMDTAFMGSHDRTEREANRAKSKQQVLSRYGKWRSRVQGNPALAKILNEVGGEGLRAFGYEPMRPLADDEAESENGYQCMLSASQCLRTAPINPQAALVASESAVSVASVKWAELPTGCSVAEGVDYGGPGNVDLTAVSDIFDSGGCCQRCNHDVACVYFTYDTSAHVCYTKSKGRTSPTVILEARTAHLVSGFIRSRVSTNS